MLLNKMTDHSFHHIEGVSPFLSHDKLLSLFPKGGTEEVWFLRDGTEWISAPHLSQCRCCLPALTALWGCPQATEMPAAIPAAIPVVMWPCSEQHGFAARHCVIRVSNISPAGFRQGWESSGQPSGIRVNKQEWLCGVLCSLSCQKHE